MSINEATVERALHETIAFHEALRRLGYLAVDIFVQCAPDGARGGKWSAFTLLRVRGMPEVNFTSGHFATEDERDEFERVWPRFVEFWNEDRFAPGERQRIYETSFAARNSVQLVLVLMQKGHAVTEGDAAMLGKWLNA